MSYTTYPPGPRRDDPSTAPPPDPKPRYYIGTDPGQSVDPTAIAIISATHLRTGSIFRCGHLERLPLNTPYPGIVAHVDRLQRATHGAFSSVVRCLKTWISHGPTEGAASHLNKVRSGFWF